MVPEKTEHKYIPPSWIDQKIVETLSKEKQQYWANRILGRPGQDNKPKLEGKVIKESEVTISFNNDGEMVVHNRAARRQRPFTPPFYTKSTHSLKKLRGQIK